MKVLLLGYSGYGSIDDANVMLTSYSLSLNENIIKSEGSGRILVKEVKDESGEKFNGFKQLSLNVVRDYPSYELSLTFEGQIGIFKKIMKSMSQTKLTNSMNVKFHDNATNISYEFSGAEWTSCQMNVDNNGLAIMTMSFVIFRSTIDVKFGSYDHTKIRNAPDGLVGDKLMPYWAWAVQYDGFKSMGPYSFGFGLARPVTPKFGCQGSTDSNDAPGPVAVIYGVPTATYNLTYVMTAETHVNDYYANAAGGGVNANEVAIKSHNLVITFKKFLKTVTDERTGEEINLYDYARVKFTHCYVDSYTPEIGNRGDVNKISMNGTVYGRIDFKETEEPEKE